MKNHPLRFFALLICFVVLAPTAVRAAQAAEKYTFVLVHGATAGGWEWKSTGKFLASYKNPAALKLPVTYVAFVPKDKSAEERAKTDRSWQRAVARGWTIRTFAGGHVAQQEDPRGVATLIEQSVNDRNKTAALPAQ